MINSALIAFLAIAWYQCRLALPDLSPWIILMFIVAVVLSLWIAFMIAWKVIGFVVRKISRNDHLFLKVPKGDLLTNSLIVVLLCVAMIAGLRGYRSDAHDAQRLHDMKQIVLVQEKYLSKTGKYYQAGSLPIATATGSSPYPFDFYADPNIANSFWIDNTGDDAKFCAYAILQNIHTDAVGCKSGCKYYIAYQSGNFYKVKQPKNLDDCILN